MLQRLKGLFCKNTKENTQKQDLHGVSIPHNPASAQEIMKQVYANQIILNGSDSIPSTYSATQENHTADNNSYSSNQTAPIPIPPSPDLGCKAENNHSTISDDYLNFTSREMQELFHMSLEELGPIDDIESFVPQDFSSGDSDITL